MSSTLSLRCTVFVFQRVFKNEGLLVEVIGLKVTYRRLSEEAHEYGGLVNTYVVLDNVLGWHPCHTELVHLDLDLLSNASQTGALGEGGVKLALMRVSAIIR